MIIPVKCFTCGNLLANKYLFYKKQVGLIKQAKNQENDDSIFNKRCFR